MWNSTSCKWKATLTLWFCTLCLSATSSSLKWNTNTHGQKNKNLLFKSEMHWCWQNHHGSRVTSWRNKTMTSPDRFECVWPLSHNPALEMFILKNLEKQKNQYETISNSQVCVCTHFHTAGWAWGSTHPLISWKWGEAVAWCLTVSTTEQLDQNSAMLWR